MRKHIAASFVVCLCLCAVVAGCKKDRGSSGSGKSGSGDGSEFSVIYFSPDGELPSSVRFPSIQIQFSKPVVALQRLGEPSGKSDIVSINPPIEGVFRWYGTSLLSFESSAAVVPQKTYTVTVSSGAVSADGTRISGQTEFSFHTEELCMTSVVPGYGEVKAGNYVDEDDVPVELARDIAVFFNAPVNASFVAKELSVSSYGTAIAFSASQESDNCVRLSLKKAPGENAPVEVLLPANSSADKDCYPTGQPQSLSFHTLQPFSIRHFRTDMGFGSQYANPVTFVMSHQIKAGTEADVAKWVTTVPAMEVTADNISINGTNIIVHGLPVTFGSQYTIQLSPDTKDIYGRTLGAYAGSYPVEVPQARSYAAFKDVGFKMLEAQFAPKIAFEHQNIKEGSSYGLSALPDADGGVAEDKAETVQLSPAAIPQNERIIQAVDLVPMLRRTPAGWRGAVRFFASMRYEYRYTPWGAQEPQVMEDTATNTQYIQVTDLGVSVRYGFNRLVALVTKLSTGEPVADADVEIYMVPSSSSSGDKVFGYVAANEAVRSGKTDSRGFVSIELPLGAFSRSTSLYVQAKTADDRALFNPDLYNMWRTSVIETGSPLSALSQKQVTFMFTDRGLYKPGETVTFRGIDRTLSGGEYASYADGKFTMQLTDGSWNPKVYGTVQGNTSQNGTFWGTFKIPEDMVPGSYTLLYYRGNAGERYNAKACGIQVQFFERLRFEAKSAIADVTYYSGDQLNADISAQYLGGGSMGDAEYQAWWSREPVGFSPDGQQFDGLSFGPVQGYDGRTSLGYTEGQLNGEGRATEQVVTGGEKLKGMAYSYRMEAQILDAGSQAVSTTARTVVHPAKFYLGVSAPKGIQGFPKKGDTLTFDYVCLSPDGRAPAAKDLPSSGKLKVELLRYDWKQVQQVSWNGQINTRYEQEMVLEDEKTVELSGSSSRREVSVVPPKGGSYLLRLSTADSRGNEIVTERGFYVTSSDWYWFSRDNSEEISMTTDKELYAVGDTAHILMQSPLEKGTYLMTIEREGILSQQVLDISVPTTVLDVKIEDRYVPVMYVTLSSYSVRGEAPQNDYDTPDLAKPKGYFGLAALCVDTSPRRFDVSISMDKPSYRPGEKASVTLHASKDGKPLQGAELTLMAVDRGVIDLIDYHVPDPVAHFYDRRQFPDCVRGGDSRSLLIDPVTYEIKNLVGGDSDDSDKMNERKNFEPTAVFVPSLVTDSLGNVTYEFTLPDSLTAYRVTVVGVSRDSYAISESQMDVSEPVSVRTVLPRQLRLDDRGEVGVTVSNLDGSAHDVTVSLAVYDGLERTGTVQGGDELQKLPGHAEVSGTASQACAVPSSGTRAVMFMVDAKSPGWITVEFTVKSSLVNERILLPLQIEKPYVYETVTTVGELAAARGASAEERIVIPGDSDDGMGSLYVQLDATRLGTLTEAVDYVFHYPYGCMEQRSAAVLPLVAFGDYMDVFGLDSEVKEPKRVAAKEIASWKGVQKSDGGFPYWPSGSGSSLEVSLRIGEVAAIARRNGISLKGGIDTDALAEYLRNHLEDGTASSWRCYTQAYALYVIAALGGGTEDFSARLSEIADSGKADLNALSLCGLSYIALGQKQKAAEIGKKIRGYTKYSTRGIDLTRTQDTPYWSYLNGKVEDYALLLQFFSELEPESDINQRLVYELLELQRASHGYWVNTSWTTRALIAIDTYIKKENLGDTKLTAEALLGKVPLVSGSFKGAAGEPVETRVPFSEPPVRDVERGSEVPVKFTAEGTGKLFYTLSMKYAVPPSAQSARDEGLCVYTEVVDVRTGEPVTDGKLVAGNVYREKVYISSTRMREYVALRAAIPAGCEVMNAAFVTTGSVPPSAEDDGRTAGYNRGLSNQAIYDSEVQYFWDYFPEGFQEVEFLFRATRKGTYNTPASTAECMYQEEIFGRSGGRVWTVE